MRFNTALSLVGASALSIAATLLIAGPLDPPAGAVASSYKTLSEVEPRIAINAANTPGDADSVFKITQPGSYYLPANVTGASGKHGIEIVASGVTIDLMGFEVRGVPGSLRGITTFTDQASLTIRNGTIRGWGQHGLHVGNTAGNSMFATIIEGVVSTQNAGAGFSLNRVCVVRACVAHDNGANGFDTDYAVTFSACQASLNTGTGLRVGIQGTATNCNAWNNDADGIDASLGSTITACTSSSNGAAGITTGGSTSVIDCTTYANNSNGIVVRNQCVIRGNNSTFDGQGVADGAAIRVLGDNARVEGNHCGNTDYGVRVEGDRNRIDGNSCNANDTGLSITGANNIIIRNTASGSTGANYSVVAGNSVAPRVGVVASDGWGGITNANHPWANFGY